MSFQRTIHLVLATTVAICLAGMIAVPVAAVPSAAQTAADRARVDKAVEQLESARQRSARIDAQAQETSAELDRILTEQQQARDRLGSRANMMYRSGDSSFIWVVLGAQSFQDFTASWDLLMRMNRQDIVDLNTLRTSRADAEQAAQSLMALQAEQAMTLDKAQREVARTRKELASSEAALKEYEARIAEKAEQPAAPAAAPAPAPSDPTQQRTGSGAWQTAVASHYGRNFTGRGASGETIGPYSMIVAHKTLPFGTLIEFEYNGKRAVAKVADRGPYTSGRTFDLGPGVVRALGFSGVHEVRYRIIGR